MILGKGNGFSWSNQLKIRFDPSKLAKSTECRDFERRIFQERLSNAFWGRTEKASKPIDLVKAALLKVDQVSMACYCIAIPLVKTIQARGRYVVENTTWTESHILLL